MSKHIRLIIKYFTVILEFCKDYWLAISRAAEATVDLWKAVFGLAGSLAGRLRKARDEERGGS